MKNYIILLAVSILTCYGCTEKPKSSQEDMNVEATSKLTDKYTDFTLTTDMSQLSDNEKKMMPILIEAAEIMNDLFWEQSYGDKDKLIENISDPTEKRFAEINFGPWDRLDGNASFISTIGDKPLGANFYPADITKAEAESAAENVRGLYTMVRRDDKGKLYSIPYSEYFKGPLTRVSELLRQAAEYADDPGLKSYLRLRAEALMNNEYYDSDMAWMSMKDNTLDIVIGPIETYEDQLLGAKAAFEAYVLVKDKTWSERLSKYAQMLPALQSGLPVDAKYKAETPGTDSDLNAYDVVYYAGDCNAGSKTIAINLPNDEKVQLAKGTRRLQLKNAMRAKFDKILIPISKELIDKSQQKHITFDAFFGNTMFHEVAHGLGIKNTINGKGTVRESLKEQASALEEGKADILGLYMITKMADMGEFPKEELMNNYVTFMAGIFRSSRFGASSAHGRANMLRFNYFEEQGAFVYNPETETYAIDFNKMKEAMNSLSELILTIQGNGDYDQISNLMATKGKMSASLQKALDIVNNKGIPVDVVFKQGLKNLNL